MRPRCSAGWAPRPMRRPKITPHPAGMTAQISPNRSQIKISTTIHPSVECDLAHSCAVIGYGSICRLPQSRGAASERAFRYHSLGALTSGWEAASTVPAGDLERARAALAAGLARGKTPAELDLAIALKPARSGAAATATPAAAQAPGFAQSALATSLDNPLGVPAWANGMEARREARPVPRPARCRKHRHHHPFDTVEDLRLWLGRGRVCRVAGDGRAGIGDQFHARGGERVACGAASGAHCGGRQLLRLPDFGRNADGKRNGDVSRAAPMSSRPARP